MPTIKETLDLGGLFEVEFTGEQEGTRLTGVLSPIALRVDEIDVDFLLICADGDPGRGASIILDGGDEWLGEITGSFELLNGLYAKAFSATIGRYGFDIPLPPITLSKAEGSGDGGRRGGGRDGGGGSNIPDLTIAPRLQLEGTTLTLTLEGEVELAFAFAGLPAVRPSCGFTIVSVLTKDNPLPRSTIVVHASIFGVRVATPELPLPFLAANAQMLIDILVDLFGSYVKDFLEDYLLGWIKDVGEAVVEMGEEVADFVEDFGDMIGDAAGAVGGLFGGGGGNKAPPPFVVNKFRRSTVVDGLMFQWGQDVLWDDKDTSFPLAQAFGGVRGPTLTQASRDNQRAALPVTKRRKDEFVVNRHDSVSHDYPFYWLALGAEHGDLPARGSQRIGDVLIQWGEAKSTSDGDQSFALSQGFGEGPIAVVTTTKRSGLERVLPVERVGRKRFVIDRDKAVDGAVAFSYLAIGPAPGTRMDEGFVERDGFILQWGRSNSESNTEELFEFHRPFRTMEHSVILTVNSADYDDGLSLTRPINEASFIVNRATKTNTPFSWIAAGW